VRASLERSADTACGRSAVMTRAPATAGNQVHVWITSPESEKTPLKSLNLSQEPAIIAGTMAESTEPPEFAPGRVVVPLPLTRSQLTEIVRGIAKTARWSINIKYEPSQEWRRLVNRRQVELCLLEGYVLDDRASLDPHDNWRFSIARVCAGLHVVIEVALQRAPAMPKLFVVGIKGDQI
jgi:hypothetical protein